MLFMFYCCILEVNFEILVEVIRPASKSQDCIWSYGHMVIQSSSHLVNMVIWSVWSYGHLVIWLQGQYSRLVNIVMGPIQSSGQYGYLVIWSSNPLVIWSSLHLVILSSDHLVIQSSGHLVNVVIWSSVQYAICHLVIWSSSQHGHLVIW